VCDLPGCLRGLLACAREKPLDLRPVTADEPPSGQATFQTRTERRLECVHGGVNVTDPLSSRVEYELPWV